MKPDRAECTMMMLSNTDRGRPVRRLVISLLVAATVLLVGATATAGPPTDFVKVKSDSLFSILNQPVGPKRTKALKTEVRALVAYDELATRALGEHWSKRTPEERSEFINLLETLVELNYANKFKKDSGDLKYVVQYTDEKVRSSTGQAIVKTEVDYGKEKIYLDYKLISKEDAKAPFEIYDIVFDDVSLEETYRESYVPIIVKEGWPSLIKRMKEKLKELEASAK